VEVSGKPVLMPFLKTNPVHPDMLDRFPVSSTHSPVIYSGQGNHVTARLLLIFAISFYATAIEKILRTTRIVLHHSIQVDGVKMFRQSGIVGTRRGTCRLFLFIQAPHQERNFVLENNIGAPQENNLRIAIIKAAPVLEWQCSLQRNTWVCCNQNPYGKQPL
jgi:hypothetical protein